MQSPHVLIVDDDPDQLRLLVAALRNTSYRVSVALNVDQGYARAAVLLPDLILLDVRMPGRNGITIARLLKTNPATQHIPIIFLSALIEQDDRLSGLRAGGVDYITKPFFVEEIQERVRIHLMLARQTVAQAQEGHLGQAERAAAPPSQSPANLTLKQVATEYILGNIQDPDLKSSDVAASLGLSMRRLNMVFESSDGLSAFEFIRQERMRRAALMLAQSTLSIADVALEVGYLNSANFSTEFKKFWQKSPTQLRSECQADPEVLQQLVASKFH
ncbi:response regulator transcription factor [Comamonas sp. MYb69]|uniref:response regulator transcription factor n=1 Tax=Comamonas sp. MYb69 TaxID=1848650 RepID=UPI0030D9BB2C